MGRLALPAPGRSGIGSDAAEAISTMLPRPALNLMSTKNNHIMTLNIRSAAVPLAFVAGLFFSATGTLPGKPQECQTEQKRAQTLIEGNILPSFLPSAGGNNKGLYFSLDLLYPDFDSSQKKNERESP